MTLVLVPTEMERRLLVDSLPTHRPVGPIELCGFGPLAAACRTMQLLSRQRYRRVILCGIAGSFSEPLIAGAASEQSLRPASGSSLVRAQIGHAYSFGHVRLHGVGLEDQQSLVTGFAAGFDTSIPDVLKLDPGNATPLDCLLTSCVATDNQSTIDHRQRLYPDAAAEDMEGFGVAMACYLEKIPLTILRGISNRCGDRDKSRWHIAPAITAVAQQLAIEFS